MARTSTKADQAVVGSDDAVNEVRLMGRLSGEPEDRELPSGDHVVVFRLVVARDDGRPDTIDCAAFRADVRRKLGSWSPGDVVEVGGSLRRRFFRAGGAPASRYEVEVRTASRVRRAAGATVRG